MSVSDLADVFLLIRDLHAGVTVLQDIDGSGNLLYEGIAADWQADPANNVWWIIKYTLIGAGPGTSKYQYSPPSQIWNNRASIFP